jgi:hypothetical protein
MDAPSIPSHHQREIDQKFPYAFYTWNRSINRFELWCDEGRGAPPYKFLTCQGPQGEYREPGTWVLDALRYSHPDTGHYKTGSKSGRKEWIQSLTDQAYLNKVEANKRQETMEKLRDETRFLHNHGRNVSMDSTLVKPHRTRRM